MRYLLLVVAAVWMAMAITTAYVPQSVPEWFVMEELGQWMRVIALIPLFMGLIMFFAAPRMHLTLYLRIIGALAVLKGIFFLVAPVKLAASLMGWCLSMPIWAIRTSAFVSLGFAIIVAVLAVISLFEEDVI